MDITLAVLFFRLDFFDGLRYNKDTLRGAGPIRLRLSETALSPANLIRIMPS